MSEKQNEFLRDYQIAAVRKMHNGCILVGGVGSGKSRTSLAYYYLSCGGKIGETINDFKQMTEPRDLYIMTPAKKRDSHDWEREMAPFGLSTNQDLSEYKITVVVESWNNMRKFTGVTSSFFIFDEQKLSGNGAWVKEFYRIVKNGNRWILLSATPADKWEDLIPVFIANGFYRNVTEFREKHLVYARYLKYPKVTGYMREGILQYYRNKIMVTMEFKRDTLQHHIKIVCDYDKDKYRTCLRERVDPDTGEMIETASSLCYLLRKVCNSDASRIEAVEEIVKEYKKAVIFYSFDYELRLLQMADYPAGTKVRQWNGHQHDDLPKGENWVYLVNYSAGAEAWNCTTTNCLIFYSQNYSYRIMIQAAGRIDRMNTPYNDLYYYHLVSRSGIDLAIRQALLNKKDFNERGFKPT